MAQTEDTELRDLVIEALEKNGSLAKIRALLRANVFLVFEDEGQNLKQNVSLDNILKLPEGALCLSIIHEFLEFCNLKNTLFVYMSESRQGTEYVYEGQKKLADKLNFHKKESVKEPILLTLLKQALKTNPRKYDQNNGHNLKTQEKLDENNYKDDENCTYIVHEDSNSSATCTSQSDNSSDEKNKLHLRLQIENSDTDTSCDSAKDKSISEYLPNQHIVENLKNENLKDKYFTQNLSRDVKHVKQSNIFGDERGDSNYLHDLMLINHSSSESTSYVDMKPFNSLDEKMLNTSGVPIATKKEDTFPSSKTTSSSLLKDNFALQTNASKTDSVSGSLSCSSMKNKELRNTITRDKSVIEDQDKSGAETAEYSNDFSSSPDNKNIDDVIDNPKSPQSVKEENSVNIPKNSPYESPRQSSQSSQSSISISDVADLISERSFPVGNQNNNSLEIKTPNNNSKKVINNDKRKLSDDSAEFSESPVPSLSNLSLDIHSD